MRSERVFWGAALVLVGFLFLLETLGLLDVSWQMFLAVVLDAFSRRIVGWAMATHLRTELVLEALQMALQRRVPGDDLVHHSDRGSQYAYIRYQMRLRRHGITCSMSRRGDCWDNAVVESFFGTLKVELLHASRVRQPVLAEGRTSQLLGSRSCCSP